MARQGRDFEILIARIEKTLAGSVTVTSPDYVTDKVTGDRREVDATLRYQNPDGEQIVGIECRDRSGAQDVMWIEQLVTKKDDLGLAKLIVVSKNGFTQGAVKKASAKGIVLKRIDQVSSEDLELWTGRLVVKGTHSGWSEITLKVTTHDPGPISPEWLRDWEQLTEHAVLFRTEEGPDISVEGVLARTFDLPAAPSADGRVCVPAMSTIEICTSPALASLINQFVPEDGVEHSCTFVVAVPPGKLFLKNSPTSRSVSEIRISGKFFRNPPQSLPEAGFAYLEPISGEERRVVQLDVFGQQIVQYEVAGKPEESGRIAPN